MLETLARNWWALVLRGVSAILFGLAAFAWPGVTLAVLILIYGVYALADGIFAVTWSLFARQQGAFPWGVLVAGLVAIAAGVIAFFAPGLTALALLYLIAAWAVVRGVFQIIGAYHLRREIENEWLLGLSGLASIVLGLLLFARPAAGALVLLWWIAGFAIFFGVLEIALGIRLRGVRGRLAPRHA